MNPQTIRELVKAISAARGEGYLIVRTQSRRELKIRLNNGKMESVMAGNNCGMGVQAFTAGGASGFAAANVIDRKTAGQLVQKAMELAAANERSGCERNTQVFSLVPAYADLPPNPAGDFDRLPPAELQALTACSHDQLRQISLPGASIAWQTSFRVIEDYWCIGRSDGTLVSFFIPRAVLLHQGTLRKSGESQSFTVNRSGRDAGILLDEKKDSRLLKQAREKAAFMEKIGGAAPIPSGSYPLLIDYGLAKGLAHEAFGHAVEADLAEESVLGENGKLKTGLVIANGGVDIVDGPLAGDWADQPYSANGQKRETVNIVRDGILKQGLGDIFSAAKAGIAMTGADRAESYGAIPLPRMSNIRLITHRRLPLPETATLAAELKALRSVLKREGLLAAGQHYVLIGYRGGQVNIKTGDFVFQCDGAVNLADPDLKAYKPGIFSGKILSVLAAVRLGIGPERYDAIGTCGKAGQMVASSGGGSGYILLAQNENIRLGGVETGRAL
jgi:TldD protein